MTYRRRDPSCMRVTRPLNCAPIHFTVMIRDSIGIHLGLPGYLLVQKGASFADREMRLLSTFTFELQKFIDEENLPQYVILSHTWEDEEITLQKLQQKDATNFLNPTKMQVVNGQPLHWSQNIEKGFLKILGCALQAEKDDIGYIWCDTCCIDKTNSTELSEAINSMFDWYKDQLCYAYLGEVPQPGDHVSIERDSAFAKYQWFTRGWTLQEFVAPAHVIFFDETW